MLMHLQKKNDVVFLYFVCSLLDEELESLEAILMDDVRIVRGAR